MAASDPIAPERHRISLRQSRPLWIGLAVGTLICAAVVVLAIGAKFLSSPFGGFNLEFTDVSPQEASDRLPGGWPAGIDRAEVQKVSLKYASTFDSHSCWYRITLSRKAAATWRDGVHLKEERRYEGARDHLDEGIEGVHRFVSGPPPLRRQTGTTPAWWLPPSIDFRATELMKWYRNYDSGVGRATYSGYDETTKTLWIYEYSAQHDRLWTAGNVPAGGQQFSTIKQSVRETPEVHIPVSDDADVKER